MIEFDERVIRVLATPYPQDERICWVFEPPGKTYTMQCWTMSPNPVQFSELWSQIETRSERLVSFVFAPNNPMPLRIKVGAARLLCYETLDACHAAA